MQDPLHSTSQSQPSNFISHCLSQYQQKINEKQNQFSEYDSEQQAHPEQLIAEEQALKYYGYEDKKSITIKPIRMHKDLIALRKENAQKRKVIMQLEKQNNQLKNKYGSSIKQNHQVEKFLKDIEFTFKNDKKAQKANQIMLKAKKMLYRQALQCQNITKKITKGQQANTVQQMKMYIEFMEMEKNRLKKIIELMKRQNEVKKEEEDFNGQNEKKFESTMERVEKMLNIEMQRAKRHQQVYKIEKAMVCTGLKQKQIILKRKSIEKYYEKLKDLMLKKQGQEYEIVVLEKKRKDKIKLVEEMKQFKNDITMKKTSIQQLEKQLKQKMKTYDYMSKWTKELKVKLQEKKENHITNKITYQKKINALSRQFEEWNKNYKLQLVEDQLGFLNPNNPNLRKKTPSPSPNPTKDMIFGHTSTVTLNPNINPKTYNNKDNLPFNNNKRDSQVGCTVTRNIKKAKLIKIEQIRKIVKKVRLEMLMQEIQIEDFLNTYILFSEPKQQDPSSETVLKAQPSKSPKNPLVSLLFHAKKPSLNNAANIQNDGQNQSEAHPNSQEPAPLITLKELFDNFKTHIPILNSEPDSQIMKLTRYIVEDQENINSTNFTDTIKTSDGYVPNLSIPKKLALTIMKKLFENELQSLSQVQQTKLKLRQFLIKFYDPFRYDILKMLLHMDGLKGINTQSAEEQKASLSASKDNKIAESQLNCSQPNGSLMMSNMKRNQHLHLQLELDEAIFLQKLKKHVVEEYYVARFKEVFDLMIYQEFGEVDKPRLGMFDRVCEMVTQKKLIKQNITPEYNFNTIKSFDECQESLENKTFLENEALSRQQLKIDTEIVIRSHKKNNNEGFWIVKPQRRISGVESVEKQIATQKLSKYRSNEEEIEEKKGQQMENKNENKYWLDDLMSDSDDSNGEF